MPADDQGEGPKIRVLIVTGGHGFEREPFFAMFKSMEGITYQEVQHPAAHDMFTPQSAAQYDVIVLYDMWQPITEEAKANLINLLKRGKGVVALHHCLVGYQDWDEYAKVIGGRYYLEPRVVGGVEKRRSAYKHGVKFKVRVADPNHPVTRGLQDFEILDETYDDFEVIPQAKPLLTTEEPTSGPVIAWTNQYGNSQIVYCQLGHDHTAYESPAYRKLVLQAISWVARSRVAETGK